MSYASSISDVPARAPKVSCHACGNIRKSRIYCVRCATTFCQRCAMRILMEMGPRTYDMSCPVCDLTCCCAQPRERGPCTRLYHCYKRCRAMRELGRTGASANPLAEASLRSKHFDPSKEHKLDSVTAQRIVNRILYAQSQPEAAGGAATSVMPSVTVDKPAPLPSPTAHMSMPPPPFPDHDVHPHQAYMDAMARHVPTYDAGTPVYPQVTYMHTGTPQQPYTLQQAYAPQDMYMSGSASAWDVPIAMLTPNGMPRGRPTNMPTSSSDGYMPTSLMTHTHATLAAAAAHSARLHSAAMSATTPSHSAMQQQFILQQQQQQQQQQHMRVYGDLRPQQNFPRVAPSAAPMMPQYPPVSLPVGHVTHPIPVMSSAAMEDSMRAMSAARAVRAMAESVARQDAAFPARPSHGSAGSSSSDGSSSLHVARAPTGFALYAPPLDANMKAMSPFGLHGSLAPGVSPKLSPVPTRNVVVVPPPPPGAVVAHAGVRRGRSEDAPAHAPNKRAHMAVVEAPKQRAKRSGAAAHVDVGLPQESQSALDLALELHEQGVSGSNMSSALAALSAMRNEDEGAIQDTPAAADHETKDDDAWQWAVAAAHAADVGDAAV